MIAYKIKDIVEEERKEGEKKEKKSGSEEVLWT